MTAFNDAANGGWEDGATWGNDSPGVEGTDFPGSSDTVTIDSHAVDLKDPDLCGRCDVEPGGTLRLIKCSLDEMNAKDGDDDIGLHHKGGVIAHMSRRTDA